MRQSNRLARSVTIRYTFNTRLSHDQSALLKRVVKARERREKAERDGRDDALLALAAGVPQSRVAEALGVTRMTMWRWLQEQADSARRRDDPNDRGEAMYQTAETGQITFRGEKSSPSLKVHEFESGKPLCGQALDPWKGNPASYTDQGPGRVTCGRCARCRRHTNRAGA